MEHGIPDWDLRIEMRQLNKNFCGKDEAVDDSLKQGRYPYFQCFLKNTWNKEQRQHQQACRCDIVIVQQYTSDADQDYKKSQNRIQDKYTPLLFDFLS